jgi:hypothetical protein
MPAVTADTSALPRVAVPGLNRLARNITQFRESAAHLCP